MKIPIRKLPKTIIENTKEKNQKILTLDSMQSTTLDDVKEWHNLPVSDGKES